MSAIVIPDDHPRVHELAAYRQRYLTAFGCATFLSPATGALTLISDQYAAVLTSKRRGVQIVDALHPKVVPVVATRPQVWMFLTARPLATDDIAAMISSLYGCGGTVLLLPGDEIPLPTPGSDRRNWITEPGEFPPFAEVVAATIRVASEEAGR
ncbi:hypothetical protein NDR87_14065 [Nocardia sp. CDC159]|uniref:Uncharacterized protein n=1 Tax=Nocardia pulmonis TaxID=2951408 RepID=A0A9X2E9S7_9NOCA|nr:MULTISPECIES: hypothetical protein [Nocardia]MCM6774451.1 hypothetical protein [Nocardia pulmonis]MCM6787483.1 hypothetical protein [Nocardia sp. CDC159]